MIAGGHVYCDFPRCVGSERMDGPTQSILPVDWVEIEVAGMPGKVYFCPACRKKVFHPFVDAVERIHQMATDPRMCEDKMRILKEFLSHYTFITIGRD